MVNDSVPTAAVAPAPEPNPPAAVELTLPASVHACAAALPEADAQELATDTTERPTTLTDCLTGIACLGKSGGSTAGYEPML